MRVESYQQASRAKQARYPQVENASSLLLDAPVTLRNMKCDLSPGSRELLAEQCDIISRRQCDRTGVGAADVRSQLRSGRWQILQRGVYATFTGGASREAELWAALLRVDPERQGAVFSHHTAAELYGLLREPSSLIHITVPVGMNPLRHGRLPGMVVHRSRGIDRIRQPNFLPPRTTIEETILDLVEVAETFDRAFHWIALALGDRRTTSARLLGALEKRKRFPNRQAVQLMLGDTAEGVRSWLEMLYVRGVERPHKLPHASRQAKIRQGTKIMYLDNLYEAYRLCVELDGVAAHSGAQQLRDKRRDRCNVVESQIVTLRFGFPDLRTEQDKCATAAEVASALRARGPFVGMPCGRTRCPV